MKMEVGELATWGMKVVDNTLRKELAGPCHIGWQEGVKSVLEERFPGCLK